MSPSNCSLCRFWHSSIGKNHYAHFLHTMIHGWGIWMFRATMLVALALHIIATVQLTAANRAARPSRYEADNTMVASKSSRMMIWSGLIILAFFVYHILHYTVRIDPGLKQLADYGENWAMTIAGFQCAGYALFYIIAMALLCSHLSHGVGSIFQTLGLRTKKTAPAIALLSKVYAVVVFIGFSSIQGSPGSQTLISPATFQNTSKNCTPSPTPCH